MRILYVPKGRAAEYGELACNYYIGCLGRCDYCYVPGIVHIPKEQFHSEISLRRPRENLLKDLTDDCIKLQIHNDTREVFLSFTHDPYNKLDDELIITRDVIGTLLLYGRRIRILTKGGKRSTRDFDILSEYPEKVWYGTTLVYRDDDQSREHEPGAAPTSERIAYLKEAHELGIKTWVSLEPVVRPCQALKLVKATYEFTDHYKVGKINHHPEMARNVDWYGFYITVVALMKELGKDYYIKADLREAAGLK